MFLKCYFIIRFQTPRDYFEDFTVSLKAESELLLHTINLVLLSEWLVVSIRFVVKTSLFTSSSTIKTLYINKRSQIFCKTFAANIFETQLLL